MKNSIQDSANCISLENPANWSDSLLISNPLPKGTGMLIAIDPNVADYPMLAAGAYEGASVLILDPNRDGIEQITTALQGSELTSTSATTDDMAITLGALSNGSNPGTNHSLAFGENRDSLVNGIPAVSDNDTPFGAELMGTPL